MAVSSHKAQKIYIGGWFQRTTLHLSEVYDFLKRGESPLPLDKDKLRTLHLQADIASVAMHPGSLDHIGVRTNAGIEIKIYEDGLVLFSKENLTSLDEDIHDLTSYYEEKLSPGIGYIFSLGAPVPKELANIKTVYPYFIVLHRGTRKDVQAILEHFREEEYLEIRKKEFEIYRGNNVYIVNNISEQMPQVERLIEEQVFMREFKGQLHRYLNLHRIIWERIAEVKEKGEIKGGEVGAFKEKVESYAKTINLIEARIGQMGTYLHTREKIARESKDFARLLTVLDFKHETLSDTLDYVKGIWGMTKNYVTSTLDLFSSIQAKSTEASVKNLTIITSMGVAATLVNFAQKVPQFNGGGLVYVAILAAVGYSTDRILKTIYKRRMYKIKDTKLAKDL